MKHEYSTYILVILISVIFTVSIINAIDSGDMDVLCNSNNSLIKKVAGVWDCSTTHYGEAYYHNYTDAFYIEITNADEYYNITGFSLDDNYGIIDLGNQRKITKTGLYAIWGTMSFRGGNGGEYEVELFVNDIAQPDCAFFRTTNTNAIGDASLSCIKSLNASDLVNMRIKDISAAPQDIYIDAFNFKIIEVQ